MNSATSGLKKPTLCRYFVSNGSCFYGNECQFIHANPPANVHPVLAETREISSSIQDGMESLVSHNDRLDSLFLAFSQQNGLPQESKLASYMNRPHTTVNNMDKSTTAVSSAVYSNVNNTMANSLSSNFGALSLDSGPNPGANEFIPRSNTPANTSGSQNSTSPTFLGYNQLSNVASSSSSNIGSTPFGRFSQGGPPFSSNYSPLHSPHVTPQNSPMLKRRTRSPNLAPINNTPLPSDAFTSPIPTYQENVGGTTYYYTHDDVGISPESHSGFPNESKVLPNFHMYPGTPAHIAHMNPKANAPSFFMPDELRIDVLHRHSLMMAHTDPEQFPGFFGVKLNRSVALVLFVSSVDLPREVDSYHNLVPLEPLPTSALEKSGTFGYVTSAFKATNIKTGLVYCLRRIHGVRLPNTKCMVLVDMWKKLQHSNIVQLREVFTTKAFGEHSIVFVHDYHPGAETMMVRHFSGSSISGATSDSGSISGKLNNADNSRSFNKGPRQHAGLLPESLIWGYVVQLSSALRTIHAAGLACRALDPSKILITGKSRIRLNCCGIFDVLCFDSNQSNPLSLMPRYQQEDLVALGKIVLALACNSLVGIQRDHVTSSMELVSRNYSADLRNLILYLLTTQNRFRSVNDIMPMIGARFYTQLDAAQMRSDVIENELSKEVENGRLFRLLAKLGIINERPEFNLDPTWSETGDRYMLKLFRDYLFHQVTDDGRPWVDLAHIVQCLNKLDAGVSEKVCLMSRDEQNVLVLSYSELKQCFESSYSDVVQAGQSKPTT